MFKPIQLLYIPNIIDYFRVLFLYYAVQYEDWRFCAWYAGSYFLDCFDGMAARALGQESRLGYYLDMGIDRVSSITALYMSANLVAAGKTFVPPSMITPVVYTLYACLILVEILSHGIVCYYAEYKGVHQKLLGLDQFTIVRLYLTKKTLLFWSCASYEMLVLSLILNASDPNTIWVSFIYI